MPAVCGSDDAIMTISSKYTVYHQLETPSSIRLLRLRENAAAGGSGGVRAELAVFDLADQECPPFTTVSYTWGEGYSDERISLNGHDHRVLESLMPFLHMLCSNENQGFNLAEHWFWIDSVCINQADISERAAQVKLMNRIYQKAQRTMVWLAEGSEDTHQALDFIYVLREKRHELRQEIKKRFKRMPLDLQDHPGWGSLERLLERPWWRRVWTLQEFIIPERLRFYCGAKSISRSAFRQGMGALELCGPLDKYIRDQVWMTAWNRRRIIDWHQNGYHRHRVPLVSLMAFCGDYGASDARDRVWAVHGLARQEDRDMIGPPTYHNEVYSLYARLVKSFVDKYGSLDIICYSQLFTRQDPSWPSWVPDWRVPLPRPSVVPLMVSQSASPHLANLRPPKPPRPPGPARKSSKGDASFRASGKETMRVSFCRSLTHLTCRGLRLDIVDGLGTSQDDYQIAAQSTSSSNTMLPNEEDSDTTRKAALYSVARALVLDRQDQFLETSAPARQFLRELKLLGIACTNNSGSSGSGRDDAASDRESVSGAESEDGSRPTPTSPAAAPAAAAPPSSAVPLWFAAWWKDNNLPGLRIRGFTLEELCQADEPGFHLAAQQGFRKRSKSFYARFRGTMKSAPRRLMVTDTGRVGIAPRQAKKGDLVCVLFGCSVPVILRPYPARGNDDVADTAVPAAADPLAGMYEFIGECFVDEFMEGEALALGKAVEEFTLR